MKCMKNEDRVLIDFKVFEGEKHQLNSTMYIRKVIDSNAFIYYLLSTFLVF